MRFFQAPHCPDFRKIRTFLGIRGRLAVWPTAKSLSPFIVRHHIQLRKKSTPRQNRIRSLDPIMQKAVHFGILKLLDHGITYPISDNLRKNPVNAFPRKSGLVMMDKLVQTQISTMVQVSMDHHKSDFATCKDQFPLPFLDQMPEKSTDLIDECFVGYSFMIATPKRVCLVKIVIVWNLYRQTSQRYIFPTWLILNE